MARGKNLNFRMKKYLSDNMRLDPKEWTYTKNTNEELVLINKNSGAKKIINKVERNITTF